MAKAKTEKVDTSKGIRVEGDIVVMLNRTVDHVLYPVIKLDMSGLAREQRDMAAGEHYIIKTGQPFKRNPDAYAAYIGDTLTIDVAEHLRVHSVDGRRAEKQADDVKKTFQASPRDVQDIAFAETMLARGKTREYIEGVLERDLSELGL